MPRGTELAAVGPRGAASRVLPLLLVWRYGRETGRWRSPPPALIGPALESQRDQRGLLVGTRRQMATGEAGSEACATPEPPPLSPPPFPSTHFQVSTEGTVNLSEISC